VLSAVSPDLGPLGCGGTNVLRSNSIAALFCKVQAGNTTSGVQYHVHDRGDVNKCKRACTRNDAGKHLLQLDVAWRGGAGRRTC
jgi:hypothetical protein